MSELVYNLQAEGCELVGGAKLRRVTAYCKRSDFGSGIFGWV